MKITNRFYVIEVGGQQHLVSDGEVITTERVDGEPNKDFDIDKVLLFVDDGKMNLGKPYLKNSVSATLLKNFLGPKVIVAKFKAKTGYRRSNGYRPHLSQLRINKIK